MQIGKAIRKVGAAEATATVFGVLAGIGGITHGIGEVLQGNVAVNGLAIDSWTSGPIARDLGGDPGFTILPTALTAGVVTLIMSCAVVAWAVLGSRQRHGGLTLVLLSSGMLLAGGRSWPSGDGRPRRPGRPLERGTSAAVGRTGFERYAAGPGGHMAAAVQCCSCRRCVSRVRLDHPGLHRRSKRPGSLRGDLLRSRDAATTHGADHTCVRWVA